MNALSENEPIPIGRRQTQQRYEIFNVIERAEGPIPASEIHRRARHAIPNMALATIYRTLKMLQQTRQIRLVNLPEGEICYEKIEVGTSQHFRCRGCRQVFTIHECPLVFLKGALLGNGFVVEDHKLTLYGRCAKCKRP